MALTQDRRTDRREITSDVYGVAAATTIYAGAMVALNTSGYLVPAAATATLKVLGRAQVYTDNSGGAAGDLTVAVEYGCYRWNNSAGADEIAATDVGAACYAVDDETVALTDATGARPQAGRIVAVDDRGVWVAMNPFLAVL